MEINSPYGRIFTFLSCLILLPISGAASASNAEFDLLILNGSIIDGTGAAARKGDLAVTNGKIVEIGDLGGRKAHTVVDADGLVVAPGFIDLHSHAEREILDMPDAENLLHQGITTLLGGNCGDSPLPIGSFVEEVEARGIAINLGLLVGHNTVRKKVMGSVDRDPTADEQLEMEAILRQSMLDGVFGMSTGLKYVPGTYSKTKEVVALAKVVSAHGGFYASHMREEGRELITSVNETIAIGREANLPVHISHIKAIGKSMWGSSKTVLAMIDEARNSGLDVTADQYPYAASSTGLNVIFPAWSLEGGDAETNERLKDPEARARIKAGIMDNINFDRGGGDPARIVVSSYPADLSIEGKNISEILQMRGLEPGVNSAAEVLMELQSTQPGGTGIYHAMSEADVSTFMRHPGISIATDAHIVKFGEAMPHPRNYGTNPRVLGNYVREKNVLTLENAIQKMTSLPAARLKLKARGVLKKDMIADIVIFDPDTVVDHAIWAQPHQYPEGIPYVFINGEAVIKNGDRTQSFPGKMLRGPAFVH